MYHYIEESNNFIAKKIGFLDKKTVILVKLIDRNKNI
jgi:hypothetical protein